MDFWIVELIVGRTEFQVKVIILNFVNQICPKKLFLIEDEKCEHYY